MQACLEGVPVLGDVDHQRHAGHAQARKDHGRDQGIAAGRLPVRIVVLDLDRADMIDSIGQERQERGHGEIVGQRDPQADLERERSEDRSRSPEVAAIVTRHFRSERRNRRLSGGSFIGIHRQEKEGCAALIRLCALGRLVRSSGPGHGSRGRARRLAGSCPGMVVEPEAEHHVNRR